MLTKIDDIWFKYLKVTTCLLNCRAITKQLYRGAGGAPNAAFTTSPLLKQKPLLTKKDFEISL